MDILLEWTFTPREWKLSSREVKLGRKEWIFTWRELKLRGREWIFTWSEYTYIHIYIYIYMYAYSHSHSHNHLSCRLLELPGISRRQVVPASLDPVGPRAA